MRSILDFIFLMGCVTLAVSIPSPLRASQRPSRIRHSGIKNSLASETDSTPLAKNRKTLSTDGQRTASMRGLSRKRQRSSGADSTMAPRNSKPMDQWTDEDWNRALDERFTPIASAVLGGLIPDANALQQIVREQKEGAEANAAPTTNNLHRSELDWAWHSANDFCHHMLNDESNVRLKAQIL